MATVFTLDGAFGPHYDVYKNLRGKIAAGNTVVPVLYDNWRLDHMVATQTGAALLNSKLMTTPGTKIVLGHSLGALVCNRWLQDYGLTNSVDPHEVSFVLIGNSARSYGGKLRNSAPTVPVDTPFTVTDISRQYDAWSDYPDNQASPNYSLAQQNVNAADLHSNYEGVDPDDPANKSYVEGNVTYVLNPTPKLPIMATYPWWGVLLGALVGGWWGALVGGLAGSTIVNEADQRVKIESAYRRPEDGATA